MHWLRPKKAVSINHEIVTPPGPDSMAGRCAARLDVSIANSRKVAERMHQYWPEKPIRVIPFLTSDRAMPEPVRSPFPGTRPLRVVYLGRMVSHKRPDKLVHSWKELSSRRDLFGAWLDVYGNDPTGEMIRKLRSIVSESQLAGSVQIHGEYQWADLPQILRQSDMVVLPSLDEGLPLVLVEAMQHGVPFVATDAGGTEELGSENPDVIITGKKWEEFEFGLLEMARRVRNNQIDPLRLHAWVESRYGYPAVSQKWVNCLVDPNTFFKRHV